MGKRVKARSQQEMSTANAALPQAVWIQNPGGCGFNAAEI
jgi:hypothetical protein